MKCVPLPATTLAPSAICLGTGGLGKTLDQTASFELLDLYVELGGNFLDTAKVYADWLPGERSSSEKTIGRWLRARGLRERVIIATKGAHPEVSTMHIPRLSPAEITADLDESLRNLRTDVVDLYWLHRDDPLRPVEEIMVTLNGLTAAGKIRCFGCSNWRAPRIREAQRFAASQGLRGFAGNQMLWSLAVVDYRAIPDPSMAAMDNEMRALHRETNLAAIPYSAQAGGLFQKMAEAEGKPGDPPAGGMYPWQANRARFERVKRLAAGSGLRISEIVLGYLMSQSFPTIPIVGCRLPGQLRDTMLSAETRLTCEQLAFLEAGDASA